MPKVSVIVPVYNVEKYVVQCIESIAGQNFKDYEVILVNDGSTDSSAQLISAFIDEKKLENFVLINKENGGVSAARNVGLDNAKGEWIAFIDGDDWVEPCYLANMVEAVERTSSDMCFSGYQAYDDQSHEIEVRTNFAIEYGKMPENITEYCAFSVVFSHLYKRELIQRHGIRFDERIRYCEDNAFNFDYSSVIKSFCFVSVIGLNYRVNREGSLTKKLIHPKVKYHLYEHAKAFCDAWGEESIMRGLKKNGNLARVLWNALQTSIVNDILDHRLSDAKKRKKETLSKAIIEAYVPRTRKDKLLSICWKMPFICLVLVVKLYYGDFETLRKTKLVRYISKKGK